MIQGITEFVPVSSDGHLMIIPRLLGLEAPDLILTIVLHAGTFISVAIFFWRDIIALFTYDKRRLALVAVATLPLLPAGLFLAGRIEPLFGYPRVAGWMLVINGVILFIAHARSRVAAVGGGRMSVWQALIIGLVQPLALLPGISRSGTTIAAGLCAGIEKEEAFRFSFLLFLPASLLALLYSVKEAYAVHYSLSAGMIVGVLLSAVVGLGALKFLFEIIKRSKLHLLGLYCIAIGVVTLCVFR